MLLGPAQSFLMQQAVLPGQTPLKARAPGFEKQLFTVTQTPREMISQVLSDRRYAGIPSISAAFLGAPLTADVGSLQKNSARAASAAARPARLPAYADLSTVISSKPGGVVRPLPYTVLLAVISSKARAGAATSAKRVIREPFMMSEAEVIGFRVGKGRALEQNDWMWICLSDRRLRSEGKLIGTVLQDRTRCLYLYLNSQSKMYHPSLLHCCTCDSPIVASSPQSPHSLPLILFLPEYDLSWDPEVHGSTK